MTDRSPDQSPQWQISPADQGEFLPLARTHLGNEMNRQTAESVVAGYHIAPAGDQKIRPFFLFRQTDRLDELGRIGNGQKITRPAAHAKSGERRERNVSAQP